MKSISILGAPSSGKTCYVAMLYYSIINKLVHDDVQIVRKPNVSQDDLLKLLKPIIDDCEYPIKTSAKDFVKFGLNFQKKEFWLLIKDSSGDMQIHEPDQFFNEIMENSAAIIVAIDPHKSRRALQASLLSRLSSWAMANSRIFKNKFKMPVAVVLTKSGIFTNLTSSAVELPPALLATGIVSISHPNDSPEPNFYHFPFAPFAVILSAT